MWKILFQVTLMLGTLCNYIQCTLVSQFSFLMMLIDINVDACVLLFFGVENKMHLSFTILVLDCVNWHWRCWPCSVVFRCGNQMVNSVSCASCLYVVTCLSCLLCVCCVCLLCLLQVDLSLGLSVSDACLRACGRVSRVCMWPCLSCLSCLRG